MLAFVFTPSSYADDLRPAALFIDADGENLSLQLKRPFIKSQLMPLTLTLDHGALPLHGPKLEGELRGVLRGEPRRESGALIESWQLQRKAGLAGLHLQLSDMSDASAGVIVHVANSDGILLNTVLSPEKSSLRLGDNLQSSWLKTALDYLWLGIEHILIGWDHLLFVLCLMMIATSIKKLLWAITGFTLAHSLTLILSSLEWVQLPIAPVEAVIALSIVFLAREILVNNKNNLSLRFPVLVSSSFGLLHGFGFASVLADIGLPSGAKFTALLSFNLGVELGQLIFVAALLALYALVNKCLPKAAALWRMPTAYLCGGLACFWTLERLASF
ncbi:HupE/UreJ family protein [Agaribacterium haliotis]|uniref:HupE/UreJ family protein n=1 Tax=Agaribacterium haliotis TaxID=2013869 RepID=UPI000BB58520|nr:HupE/UreJ family protein [Agaribacterium haliotis]